MKRTFEPGTPVEHWHAEYVPYMKAYRLYNPRRPYDTIAYVDDLEQAREQAWDEYHADIAVCDADTMHVECP